MMMTTVLTDIEGTTSSIAFVKDVLFPYARRALPGFVREHGSDPEVRRWLDMVATEHGAMCDDAMVVETLQGWIDEDRKHTAPCSTATASSQRRTSGSSPCSRTKPGRARRAYGNSTSFTNEIELVVPSMSVRIAFAIVSPAAGTAGRCPSR